MQNIEKDQFQMFWRSPESFRFTNENCLLQIEIAKNVFLGDWSRKTRQVSAFITISVYEKI